MSRNAGHACETDLVGGRWRGDGPAMIFNADELSCKELVELVTDWADDRLASDVRARFEVHLARCESCRAYVAQLRTTVRLTGRLAAEAVPASVQDALLDAFRGWKRGQRDGGGG